MVDGSYLRAFPERTLPLPPSVLPQVGLEPEFAVDEVNAVGESTTTTLMGMGGAGTLPAPPIPPGIDGGYTSRYTQGAPHWPLPQRQSDTRRTVVAAVVGLVIAIVALILVAALLVNAVQSALTAGSNSTPRGVISASASPSPHSQPIAATSTATGITTDPTATSGDPINWLEITPTQVSFTCGSVQIFTLTLSNTGKEEF